MNKTLDELRMNELSMEEMEQAAGGHPFEDCFGDIALYRAGVTYVNVVFGSDRYYIGSTQIDKELARQLRAESTEIWKAYFAESGDFVGFAQLWKAILATKDGISWNGLMGEYQCSAT